MHIIRTQWSLLFNNNFHFGDSEAKAEFSDFKLQVHSKPTVLMGDVKIKQVKSPLPQLVPRYLHESQEKADVMEFFPFDWVCSLIPILELQSL
jgi:hypothetical protein